LKLNQMSFDLDILHTDTSLLPMSSLRVNVTSKSSWLPEKNVAKMVGATSSEGLPFSATTYTNSRQITEE